MEMWFSQLHTANVKLNVRIDRQLFSGESEFQRIDVFESEDLGKFVVLDGDIVFSDRDEFIYDEMVTPRSHGGASQCQKGFDHRRRRRGRGQGAFELFQHRVYRRGGVG